MTDIRMRYLGFRILSLILMLAGLAAAFYAGHSTGLATARRQDAIVLNEINDSAGVYAFFTLERAIKDLRNTKIVEADTIILRFAKLQIPKVLSCSQSTTCSRSAGSAMPVQEDIDYIRLMTELAPTK